MSRWVDMNFTSFQISLLPGFTASQSLLTPFYCPVILEHILQHAPLTRLSMSAQPLSLIVTLRPITRKTILETHSILPLFFSLQERAAAQLQALHPVAVHH